MNITARRQSSTTSLSRYARANSPNQLDPSLDFCNSFWGVGDGGVDVLLARMRGAARTMEELRAFWKERAAIEEDYAKRLGKLSKMVLGRDEIGDLRKSLDTVRYETECQAAAHLDLAQKIHAELDVPTSRFHQRQVEYKKTKQTEIQQKFKNKQIQEGHVNKAREKYEQDCLRINSFTAQASLVQGKDLEKINLKLERTQQTVRTNERDFAHCAQALAGTVQRWEEEWKDFCDACQDLEEDRLDFTKDTVWNYANLVSTVCVFDDESCERVRLSLEQMETEKEIQGFVHDYGTGNQIPDPPKFVNYQSADVVPQASARPTVRPAQFIRSSARPLAPMPMNPYSMDDEPIVNAAGVGAGGGAKPTDPYANEGPADLNRRSTRGGSAPIPYMNGHTPSHASSQSSGQAGPSRSPPAQVQQPIQPLQNGRTPANKRASTVGTPAQQLRQVLHDPHAEPIDPNAETYIKVGTNAYKVDPNRDPQGSSGIRASMSSPVKANGNSAAVDPLVKQLEELQQQSSSTNSARRNTLIKPRTTDSQDARSNHVPSVAASSTSTRSGATAGPGPSSLSLSPPPTASSAAGSSSQRATTPVRDYRNSADMVVGAHPSSSRPPSPNPPTAAFMVPKPSAPPPGSDVVQEVLAGYQQSLPGERKSMILSRSPSRAGHPPSVSPVSGPTHGHSNSIGQSQGAMLQRPLSQMGHAGIGAHGSRSNSPQPISRGSSPAPGQVARNSTYIQPPAASGAGLARSPSPSVGIALDPSGRVAHDEMAQRFQQQQYRGPPSQQPAYAPPPAPAQQMAPHQAHGQQPHRRSSFIAPVSNTMAPPMAPQSYPVTPPPGPQMYPAPSPQPNYAPPPQPVQQVYNQPPPAQYQQPPHQQQQQQQQQQMRYQQAPSSPYGSVNGVQRGNSVNYYGNQTPPQQQPIQHAQQQPQMMGHVQQQRTGYQPPQQQQQAPQQYGYSDQPGRSPSPQPPAQLTEDGSPVLFYVKALYDYTATIDEEFDFQAGDIIAVTATPEDGWWSGELLDEARRQKGRHVFPSNFVCLF
ncbi:hypothetical protein CVT24_002318 [Panaeolus cyanescens]|uniref:SH3 domain-containing protein n=1 Tax=Panaeolus cyanescens TaxID=181874 RepID=A0A409WV38_9AGAR|nr:hypothetical protein CVT24_002318 [Panaeolus cyanescens]